MKHLFNTDHGDVASPAPSDKHTPNSVAGSLPKDDPASPNSIGRTKHLPALAIPLLALALACNGYESPREPGLEETVRFLETMTVATWGEPEMSGWSQTANTAAQDPCKVFFIFDDAEQYRVETSVDFSLLNPNSVNAIEMAGQTMVKARVTNAEERIGLLTIEQVCFDEYTKEVIQRESAATVTFFLRDRDDKEKIQAALKSLIRRCNGQPDHFE